MKNKRITISFLFILCFTAITTVKAQVEISSTGVAAAYILDVPAIFPLRNGVQVTFKANVVCTASPTINVTGTGAILIKKEGGATNLAAGDIKAGQVVHLVYDGTFWQMLSSVGNSASSTAWNLGGNGVTSIQTIGTTTAFDLPFITSNIERMRLNSAGTILFPSVDNALSLGSVANSWKDINADGYLYINGERWTSLSTNNTLIGTRGNQSYTTGLYNVGVGYGSGNGITTGYRNTFVGHRAGELLSASSDNTLIGHLTGGLTSTLGDNNTLIGSYAGYGGSNSGVSNTYVGAYSGGNNTTGNSNAFLGHNSGANNTTGYFNTFIGVGAGQVNLTGNLNTFTGSYSGNSNITDNNTFYGYSSGRLTTTGGYNVFTGTAAGNNNTTGFGNSYYGGTTGYNNNGSFNSFMGYGTGYNATSGDYNTLIGTNAGGTVALIGTYNTYLGYNAIGSASLTNATAIGKNASVTASNSLILGGGGPDAVNVGIGATAPAGDFHIFKNNGPRVVLDADGANVNGSSTLDFTTSGNGSATSFVGTVSGWQLRSFTSGYSTVARQNDFQLRFYDGAAFNNVMYFDNSGFVGIGNIVPTTNLHVTGGARITNLVGPGTVIADINGNLSVAAGGSITGAGTPNYLARWTPSGSELGIGVTYDNGTNVGIGTTNPLFPLHVANNSFAGIAAQTSIAAAGSASSIGVLRSRGTTAAPTAILLGDNIGQFDFVGYTGSAFNSGANIKSYAAENFGAGAGADLAFNTANIGTTSPSERMRISAAGNIAINAAPTTTDYLFVNRPTDFGPNHSAIYAFRAGNSTEANGGTSWAPTAVDAVIKGYNNWGNNYTSGVAGYNYQDYKNSAAVIGADASGNNLGALSFKDNNNLQWGLYTSVNAFVGTNLGIALSPGLSPTANLHVQGSARITGLVGPGTVISDASGNLSVATGGTITGSGIANYVARWTPTGSILGTGLIYDNGAVVGIGTGASPSASRLHVHSTSGSGNLRLTSAATLQSATDGFSMTNDGTTAITMIQHENADWNFATNGGTVAMTIKPTTNIGLGTGAPSGKLHLFQTTGSTRLEVESDGVGGADAPVIEMDASGTNVGQSVIEFRENNVFKASTGWSTLAAQQYWFVYDGASAQSLVYKAGRVGVGTNTPAEILNLVSTDSDIDAETYSTTESSSLHVNRGRGTVAAPASVVAGDYFGGVGFKGYVTGASFLEGAVIEGVVDGTPSTTSMPGRLEFMTTPIGSTTAVTRMVIKNNGDVGIGATPTEKLEVSGNMELTALADVYKISNNQVLSINGTENTFVGVTGSTGSYNTIMGYSAGNVNTGISNTMIGRYSGLANTSGAQNVFLGLNSGTSNTTGSYNTFIGRDAGTTNVTGSNNTTLGYDAEIGSSALTNATAIGSNAVANISNSVILGSGASVGIGTSSPAHKLDVVGNIVNTNPTQGTLGLSGDLPGFATSTYPTLKTSGANLYFSVNGLYSAYMNGGGVITAVSDRNKKENITEINYQEILQKIDRLPITQWNYKSEDKSIRHISPMAQDFHELFKLNGDNDKMISNIDPSGIALVGVKALSANSKEQQKQIDELRKQIAELKQAVEQLQKK